MRRVELTADEQELILGLEQEAAPYLLSEEEAAAPLELPGDLGDRMEDALEQIAREHGLDPGEIQVHADPRSRSAWVTVGSERPGPSRRGLLIHRHHD